MKVYFFSKKTLIGSAVIALLICGFLGLSLIYYSDTGVASRMTEPIYQGNTGEKLVAISVNVDWGEEHIPAMLEEFKRYDAQATFYVTGLWAEKNPDMLKKIDKAGHSIQNHSYKHVHFNTLSQTDAINQIKKAEDIIYNIIEKRTKFFSSPYGEQSRQIMTAVSSINYDLIMWSIDTIDWQKPTPDMIIKRVLNKIHNDAIILMHPTEPTVQALPEMLNSIKEQGYKMVTIDKILVEKDGTGVENVKKD
ncbi:MAG TPA: polysaccharide deacetylase family protein [Syntrophomonadaceae bacterium]|nr:polysaccharide deacetylase family protein [Syntrophomonadaceae bacterium]